MVAMVMTVVNTVMVAMELTVADAVLVAMVIYGGGSGSLKATEK